MVIKRNFSAELPIETRFQSSYQEGPSITKEIMTENILKRSKVAPSATIVGRLINEQQNIMSQPHT